MKRKRKKEELVGEVKDREDQVSGLVCIIWNNVLINIVNRLGVGVPHKVVSLFCILSHTNHFGSTCF